MGLPDGQLVSRQAMLDRAAQIAAAVPLPVTADLEAGYGPSAEDVAVTVRGALRAGAVGCNIEDATGNPDKPLLDIELACDRIRAGTEVARHADQPFVLNARTDPYLVRRGADIAGPPRRENETNFWDNDGGRRCAGDPCYRRPLQRSGCSQGWGS